METIVKKNYIRIEFTAASPLLIGSSSSTNTDCDVLRNSRNKPYIPGSSIAGALRDAMKADGMNVDHYFGFIEKNTGSGNSDAGESRLVFHDAVLKDGKFTVNVRDHVCLDEFKTAVDGAKFDTEVLEAGAVFVTVIEQNCTENDQDILEPIASVFINESITFGAKTVRGFGRITAVKVMEESFDLTDAEDTKKWLSFKPYEESSWKNTFTPEETESDECSLNLELELIGGISIRRYTTEVAPKGESVPDYRQLTALDEKGNSLPVIPGSSWAGAIMHRIFDFGEALSEYKWEDDEKNEHDGDYFGFVRGNDKMKSQITFSESRIAGGADKEISRNAIDRFSGGTVNGALFTERMHYGGTCELRIGFIQPKNKCYSQEFLNAFAAALTDLHNGYLAVGGLTAVGRGVFRIIKVNGEDLKDKDAYSLIQKKLNRINQIFKEATINDGNQ